MSTPPSTTLGSFLWIARFERVSEAPEQIELIISGGYGNQTLKWRP